MECEWIWRQRTEHLYSITLDRFVRSSGPLIFRTWILEASKNLGKSNNRDMVLTSIAILKALPFDLETLKDSKLGRLMKGLSTDKEADKGKTMIFFSSLPHSIVINNPSVERFLSLLWEMHGSDVGVFCAYASLNEMKYDKAIIKRITRGLRSVLIEFNS